MSIQVNGLTKIYKEQTAVNDISFTINKGEIVGFLGPNGAGKSTTMKMLSCFIPPSSGSAIVAGFDILKDPMQVKARVGYLPESNPLYLEMYVREYLDLIAGINKIKNRKQRIEELIEITGLSPECNKQIGQLSKGYKQRVGLAQALLNNPDVLILDEPTSGLDPNQLVDIRKLIKEIGKEKTVMLSTHIMQEVEQMCDRVLIIKSGQIVKDENVNTIGQEQKSIVEYAVQFLLPVKESELANANLSIKKQVSDKQFIILAADKEVLARQVFQFSKTYNNPVCEMKAIKEDLESVFRAITNNN
jgi:ABC-2 type transport system ATP-binding protein